MIRPGLARSASLTATLVALAAAGPARSGEPRLDEARAAVSLTVSGGVSLGTYEAGFLSESLVAMQRQGSSPLRLLTGASAGSLNALLAALTACGTGGPTSSRSLFRDTWIPVGFDQLFVPARTTALGVFSRDWLERGAARIEAEWNRGLSTSCDVVLGVAVTRVEPRVLRAAGGLIELSQLEDKFAVRIQGRGPGRPPRATNYGSPSSPRREPLLVTDAAGEIAFPALRDLLFASMSFPVAFPPQPLASCVSGATAAPGVCPPGEAQTSLYVDGGVFDNTPLRLAVELARTGLEESPGGALRWRAAPDRGVRTTPGNILFASVDPDAVEYPRPRQPRARSSRASLPREVLQLLSAMVDTARSKELAVLLEEEPDIADRFLLPRRRYPAASAPLVAFLGFFETEFREFDFTLGRYDAFRMVEVARATGALPPAASSRAPGAADPGEERFACMRAVYDGAPEAADACQAATLADFRALLQVSLDQLYDACRTPSPGPPVRWDNPRCEHAAAGEPPPRVPGLAPQRWPSWQRGRGETDLAYSMRLLSAYGFSFRDLGVPAGRGDLAVARIRSALGRAVSRLAAMQPFGDRQVVGFAGKLAADAVAYSPPDRVVHLTMGPTETELGLSYGFFGARRVPPGLRFAGAVGVRGLGQVFASRDREPLAVLAVAGFELQPPPTSNAFAQLRLGLRAGWLFAADDGYGAGRCRDRGDASVSACSRGVVQALVGITAVERVRLQLVGAWYPETVTRATQWSIAPGIGLELGF